jgi:3-keto-disaccharide hydrolase
MSLITLGGKVGTLLVLFGLVSPLMGQSDSRSKSETASVLGRWDVTVHGSDGDYPSWLEVRLSGSRTLVGSYVGQFGSARPISKVNYDKGQLSFTVPPQWERRGDDVTFEGKLTDGMLSGETTDDTGKRLRWEARRAPSLKREKSPQWADPVDLFNGSDLSGWKPRSARAKNGWVVREGALVNAQPGNDLVTERQFTDFKLHAEFRYPRGSNSGVYLRGRYELQIEDNYGDEPDNHKIGSVYGFLTPSLNAAKKAGEWQTLEVTLVGRQLTVELNDEKIIDRQSIPGITGGALDSHEGEPGPIMLQGDHGVIEFRKVSLTPARS